MFRSLRSAAMVAAIIGAAGGAPALAMQPAPVMTVPATKPGKRALFNDMVLPQGQSRYGRKGAGITMAQQKRASNKKRNRVRHRAHCK